MVIIIHHERGIKIMDVAVVHREDDWFVAECPETGTASQGHTLEEALANLKEAAELYMEEAGAPAAGRSVITTVDNGSTEFLMNWHTIRPTQKTSISLNPRPDPHSQIFHQSPPSHHYNTPVQSRLVQNNP
jgi:predicted RNase H-like HicB family nuclease